MVAFSRPFFISFCLATSVSGDRRISSVRLSSYELMGFFILELFIQDVAVKKAKEAISKAAESQKCYWSTPPEFVEYLLSFRKPSSSIYKARIDDVLLAPPEFYKWSRKVEAIFVKYGHEKFNTLCCNFRRSLFFSFFKKAKLVGHRGLLQR